MKNWTAWINNYSSKDHTGDNQKQIVLCWTFQEEGIWPYYNDIGNHKISIVTLFWVVLLWRDFISCDSIERSISIFQRQSENTNTNFIVHYIKRILVIRYLYLKCEMLSFTQSTTIMQLWKWYSLIFNLIFKVRNGSWTKVLFKSLLWRIIPLSWLYSLFTHCCCTCHCWIMVKWMS